MTANPPPTAAERLRRHADLVLELAERFDEPSRSLVRAERLIAEVEEAAATLRAIARGRATG